MGAVIVSPKYQVVIPKDVRDSLRIKPGQRFRVFACGDRVQMIPVREMRELRGFAKGASSVVPRENDRT